MKKIGKIFGGIMLVICLAFPLALSACGSTFTVTYQNGNNYRFTDVNGEDKAQTEQVKGGETVKFKVVTANLLVKLDNVTANGTVLTPDTDGVYTLTVEGDVRIAAKTGTIDNAVKSIAVSAPPTVGEYKIGDTFDPAGMVITALFTDGTSRALQASEYVIKYQNGSLFAEGDNKVIVEFIDTFDNKVTTDVTVTVKNVTLESLFLSGALSNTEFFTGDVLKNIDGLIVKAVYSDDSETALTFAQLAVIYETDGSEAFSNGDTKFTLKYGEKTVDVTGITVRDFEAYNSISVQLELVGGKPILTINGILKDASVAVLNLGSKGTSLKTVQGVTENERFTVTADLSVVMAQAKNDDWYDMQLGWAVGKYVDLNKDMCENFNAEAEYDNKVYSFRDYQGDLKIMSHLKDILIETFTLKYVNNVPTLVITGTTGKSELAAIITDDKKPGHTLTGDVTLDNGNFSVTFNLNDLPVSGDWYNIKIGDLTAHKEDLTEALAGNTFYGTTNKIDIVSWSDGGKDTLSFSVSSFLFREVTARLTAEADTNKPILTVSGIYGDAAALYLYIGSNKAADVTLNEADHTFTATLDLSLTVSAGTAGTPYDLGLAAAPDAAAPAKIAYNGEAGDGVTYDNNKYVLENNGGNFAVKFSVAGLPNTAEITLIEGQPVLTVTGDTSALSVKVRLGQTEKTAVIENGKYKANFQLSELLIVGKAYLVEIKEDDGEFAALTTDTAEYIGNAVYRLTTAPRHDMYAKNTYGFSAVNKKIAVTYEQSTYNAENVLVSTVKSIYYDANGKFCFTYPSAINSWGALKKGGWIYFGDPVTVGEICTRTISDNPAFSTGIWTVEYTVGALNNMDDALRIVYDGKESGYIHEKDDYGYLITNGIVSLYKGIKAYSSTAALTESNGQAIITVSGQFTDIPADTTGYGVHYYYNAGGNFEGTINQDGTFTYTYTFAADSAAGTMYLHMLNADTEVNLIGGIADGQSFVTVGGRTYTLVRGGDGSLTVTVALA